MRNLAAAWMLVGAAAACGVSGKSSESRGTAYDSGSTGSGTSAHSSGSTTGGSDTATTSTSGGGKLPEPGQLTAGAWDDNRNYDFFKKYLKTKDQLPGIAAFSTSEHDAAHAKSQQQPGGHDLLDIAIVLDTTGSMGDEIMYLQSELDSIANTIAQRYPSAQQRWGLVAYKDDGDEYVVKAHDFSELAKFKVELLKLSAGGGGDLPEAPDKALHAATELTWRQSGAARMLFWVADAPHHAAGAPLFASAVRAASQGGVHIYPIASSGVDPLAEYSMRQSAQLTGGRYLFLTDDSGIGNSHKVPEIPCFFVTKLTNAIERMVDIEMTGIYREPTAKEIIRTGGNPKDGRCTVAAQEFVVF